MNQEEREANNILNALQNAVADVSAQAGGRKRRSRKPKSKKSMRGGAAPATQAGGRRRRASKKSKKSKSRKSSRGGSVQAGGRRRSSKKSKMFL